MAITGSSERVALKALKASNWHLEEAFHMFYGQPHTRTVVDSRHLEELYNRYKDPCVDMILVDGITLLCSDLQVRYGMSCIHMSDCSLFFHICIILLCQKWF